MNPLRRALELFAGAGSSRRVHSAAEVQRIAVEKRRLERELRAAGHSRKEAVRLVWERFRDRG